MGTKLVTDKIAAQVQICAREVDLIHKNLFEHELTKLRLLQDQLRDEVDQPASQIYEHRKLTEKLGKLQNEILQLAVHRDEIRIKVQQRLESEDITQIELK